jgi:hypothetical protein
MKLKKGNQMNLLEKLAEHINQLETLLANMKETYNQLKQKEPNKPLNKEICLDCIAEHRKGYHFGDMCYETFFSMEDEEDWNNGKIYCDFKEDWQDRVYIHTDSIPANCKCKEKQLASNNVSERKWDDL